MKNSMALVAVAACIALLVSLIMPAQADQNDQVPEYAESLYQERCAACHDGSLPESPTREALELLPPSVILEALTTGSMKAQAEGISSFDREHLAIHLGKAAGDRQRRAIPITSCSGTLTLDGPIGWNRWGGDKRNSRFRSQSAVSITAENVSRLRLKWAFGFPNAVRARSQPAVTQEAIFTGSQDGTVYALDTQTGCVWWRFFAEAEVRNAPTIGLDDQGRPHTLYFADYNANVYAVDASTGEERWRVSVKDHPVGTVTGSMALHDGRLYVPMSSSEVISAYIPDYPCCTFRGGLLALDAATGERVWRFYTVPEPQPTGENARGAPSFGPSGAPIWSVPTIDEKRGLVYVGTGQNYSSPATGLSDAILAIHLEDGSLAWAKQLTPNDAWNGACFTSEVNCPKERGPDFDFGAAPVLTTLPSGRDVLFAGQKSGMVYALDPYAEGEVLWQQRAGQGGFNGGVHWGMASDGTTLFVGISDTPRHWATVGPPRPGVHAYDAETGEPLWSQLEPPFCNEPKRRCMTAISAPLTATPDLIFAGALNGLIRIYDTTTGDVVWTYDTMKPFDTINGIDARGGSIDSAGIVATDGMLIVNSGYDKFGNIPGHVLLVFDLEEGED